MLLTDFYYYHLFFQDTYMLNSLRIQRDATALESFNTADLPSLLRNVFPGMVSEFKGFINKFVPDEPAIALTSKQNDFLKEVMKHSYMDISPLTAYVPEGLNVSYYKYSEHLLPAAKYAANILSGTLSAYTVFLSQLISNKDQKFSTTSFMATYKGLDNARNKMNMDLGGCFKRGSTVTDVTFGDVVDRNADWQHVFQVSNEVTKLINTVDRKALNKKIAECAELLNIIMEKIKRNEFDGISPQAINNLADGTYQIASELEMFSVIYYKVSAYAESINRTIANFNLKIDQ